MQDDYKVNQDVIDVLEFKDDISFCYTKKEINSVINDYQNKLKYSNELSIDDMLTYGEDMDIYIAGIAVLIKNKYFINNEDCDIQMLKTLSVSCIRYSLENNVNIFDALDYDLLTNLLIKVEDDVNQYQDNENKIIDNSIIDNAIKSIDNNDNDNLTIQKQDNFNKKI